MNEKYRNAALICTRGSAHGVHLEPRYMLIIVRVKYYDKAHPFAEDLKKHNRSGE